MRRLLFLMLLLLSVNANAGNFDLLDDSFTDSWFEGGTKSTATKTVKTRVVRGDRNPQTSLPPTYAEMRSGRPLVTPLDTDVSPAALNPPRTLVWQSGSGARLVKVDNPEYVRRRAAALQKPNAVVGQVTLQAE